MLLKDSVCITEKHLHSDGCFSNCRSGNPCKLQEVKIGSDPDINLITAYYYIVTLRKTRVYYWYVVYQRSLLKGFVLGVVAT